MFKILFVFTALFLKPILTLATTILPNNCTPSRQAKAEVKLERLHWEEVNGDFKLKSEVVCTKLLEVGVLSGTAAGCIYPVLAKCETVMDGKKHLVMVSGMIYHNDELGTATKHFILGYHLDRNSGNLTTGEAASSDVFTADLSLKKISVSVRSKLDGPAPGSKPKAFRDGLVVTVNYGDQNAP